MLDRLIEFSIRNRLLVILVFAMTMLVGGWRLAYLPVDAFPDTTPIQVQINTVAPALSPEEIEQQITLLVELSIGGLPGLDNVRSISKFGLSQIVATFDDTTTITDARQYISERLASVSLPDGIGSPELARFPPGWVRFFITLFDRTIPADPSRKFAPFTTGSSNRNSEKYPASLKLSRGAARSVNIMSSFTPKTSLNTNSPYMRCTKR